MADGEKLEVLLKADGGPVTGDYDKTTRVRCRHSVTPHWRADPRRRLGLVYGDQPRPGVLGACGWGVEWKKLAVWFHDHGCSGALGITNPDTKEGVMSRPPAPLLSVRSACVLMLALVVAIIAGVLSYLSAHDLPAATLTAGGAGAGAVLLFHTLLGR